MFSSRTYARVRRQRCFSFRHSQKRQPRKQPRGASLTWADVRRSSGIKPRAAGIAGGSATAAKTIAAARCKRPCRLPHALGPSRSWPAGSPNQPAETRLRGWAFRIRTGESVRALSDWNSVTTSPKVGASPGRRRFACELRDTDFAAPAKISADDLSTEERTASRGSRRIRYGHGTRNSPMSKSAQITPFCTRLLS
jgi:hypothetical protein